MELEFVGIEPEVVAELARGRHAREVLELTSLKEQFNGLGRSPQAPVRQVEGLGQATLSVPPLSYHYWGRRLGYECWSDPGFRREFARDNPGARIASEKIIRVPGGFGSAVKRFRKSYT